MKNGRGKAQWSEMECNGSGMESRQRGMAQRHDVHDDLPKRKGSPHIEKLDDDIEIVEKGLVYKSTPGPGISYSNAGAPFQSDQNKIRAERAEANARGLAKHSAFLDDVLDHAAEQHNKTDVALRKVAAGSRAKLSPRKAIQAGIEAEAAGAKRGIKTAAKVGIPLAAAGMAGSYLLGRKKTETKGAADEILNKIGSTVGRKVANWGNKLSTSGRPITELAGDKIASAGEAMSRNPAATGAGTLAVGALGAHKLLSDKKQPIVINNVPQQKGFKELDDNISFGKKKMKAKGALVDALNADYDRENAPPPAPTPPPAPAPTPAPAPSGGNFLSRYFRGTTDAANKAEEMKGITNEVVNDLKEKLPAQKVQRKIEGKGINPQKAAKAVKKVTNRFKWAAEDKQRGLNSLKKLDEAADRGMNENTRALAADSYQQGVDEANKKLWKYGKAKQKLSKGGIEEKGIVHPASLTEDIGVSAMGRYPSQPDSQPSERKKDQFMNHTAVTKGPFTDADSDLLNSSKNTYTPPQSGTGWAGHGGWQGQDPGDDRSANRPGIPTPSQEALEEKPGPVPSLVLGATTGGLSGIGNVARGAGHDVASLAGRQVVGSAYNSIFQNENDKSASEKRITNKGRGKAEFKLGNKIETKGLLDKFRKPKDEEAMWDHHFKHIKRSHYDAETGTKLIKPTKYIEPGGPEGQGQVKAQYKTETKGLVSDILGHLKPLGNVADDVVAVGVRKVANSDTKQSEMQSKKKGIEEKTIGKDLMDFSKSPILNAVKRGKQAVVSGAKKKTEEAVRPYVNEMKAEAERHVGNIRGDITREGKRAARNAAIGAGVGMGVGTGVGSYVGSRKTEKGIENLDDSLIIKGGLRDWERSELGAVGRNILGKIPEAKFFRTQQGEYVKMPRQQELLNLRKSSKNKTPMMKIGQDPTKLPKDVTTAGISEGIVEEKGIGRALTAGAIVGGLGTAAYLRSKKKTQKWDEHKWQQADKYGGHPEEDWDRLEAEEKKAQGKSLKSHLIAAGTGALIGGLGERSLLVGSEPQEAKPPERSIPIRERNIKPIRINPSVKPIHGPKETKEEFKKLR